MKTKIVQVRILNTTPAPWYSNTVQSMTIIKFILIVVVLVGDDYNGDNGENPDAYGYAQCQDSSGLEDKSVSSY